MKYLIIIIFFNSFILFSQKSKYVNIIDNDSIIVWDKKRKIKWIDFKGKELINKNANAESAIGIIIKPILTKKLDYKYLIFAYFDKRKSTYKKGSNYLLKHEQIHFDIGEIFARKIRKEVLNKEKGGIENIDYQEIFTKFYNQYVIFYTKYDKETEHSRNYSKQKEWGTKVLRELEKLKKYEWQN